MQNRDMNGYKFWSVGSVAVLAVAVISALYCGRASTGQPVTGSNPMSKVPSGTYVAACHQDAAITAALSARLTYWVSTVTLNNSTDAATILHQGFSDAACTTAELSLSLKGTYLLETRTQDALLDLRLNSDDTELTALTDAATTDLNTGKICGLTFVKATSAAIADASCTQGFIFASGHNFWGVLQPSTDSKGFTTGATFSRDANQISAQLSTYEYRVK